MGRCSSAGHKDPALNPTHTTCLLHPRKRMSHFMSYYVLPSRTSNSSTSRPRGVCSSLPDIAIVSSFAPPARGGGAASQRWARQHNSAHQKDVSTHRKVP